MANKTLYPFGVGGQTPSGIDIVDDLTTGGHDKAASAETVKELAQHVFMGSGTFAEAYDKARNSVVNFPWMLNDTDDEGNVVKKMIWHIGNKRFVDAIGADIDGTKNGLTVTTTQACDMKVNSTTVQLSVGENNFTASELGLVSNDTTSAITTLAFYESGTQTSKITQITGIDFGNLVLRLNAVSMNDYTNLEIVKRLNVSANSWFYRSFRGNKVTEVAISGTMDVSICGFFPSCTQLKKVDASGLTVSGCGHSGTPSEIFSGCTALKEVDIRNFNTSNMKLWATMMSGAPIKKLTIGGNFSNVAMTSKSNAFSGTTGADLFITSTTPPNLKNCTFTDGTANDVHGLTYDWLSYSNSNVETCRFRAIYVPDEAVNTYKTNVYVENGTIGNTGWSYYASIIKGISEYVE